MASILNFDPRRFKEVNNAFIKMINKIINAAANAFQGSPRVFDTSRLIYGKVVSNRYPLHAPLSRAVKFLSAHPKIIQLGASDGMRSDPYRAFIIERKWHAVLVEPIPESFSRLVMNYRPYSSSGRIHLLNAAVSYPMTNMDGNPKRSAHLFRYSEHYIRRAGESKRLELLQKTSFDRQHLMKWDSELDAEVDIDSFEIPAFTVEQLAQKYFDGACDILAMDLEGYEPTVLMNLDFSIVRPAVIVFEFEHIPANDLERVRRRLLEEGYSLDLHGADLIASRISEA